MKTIITILGLLFLTSCADSVKLPFSKSETWSLKLCEGISGAYRNCEMVDDKIPTFEQCTSDQRGFSRMLPKGERRSVVCLSE